MSGEKKFTDYAEEYDACMEVLDQELPEYEGPDPETIKPRIDERKLSGVNTLFGSEDEPDEDFFDMEKHWVGMPECETDNLMPYKKLLVLFKDEDDMIAFGKKVDQKITKKTKSIWFPKRAKISSSLDRWIDEAEAEELMGDDDDE